MNDPQLNGILRRVLAGDVDQYSDIIRLHQQDVWRVVAAMLLNTSQTEDLVQQTFVTAFRHLHEFDTSRDFGVWIKQIARNTVRQELRSRARELQRLEQYHQHLLASWEDNTPIVADTDLDDALRKCVEQLPPEGAEVIELRYRFAWDFTQIAKTIGRTVEASRQHLARVRIALRDCIRKRVSQPNL